MWRDDPFDVPKALQPLTQWYSLNESIESNPTPYSVVIPFKEDSEIRTQNLEKVIEFFNSKNECKEILVVHKLKKPNLVFEKGKIAFIPVSGEVFHKTYMVNLGFSLLSTEVAVLCDADCIPNPAALQLASFHCLEDVTLCYPYNGKMMEAGKVLYGEHTPATGGCAVFNRKKFIIAGGFNEEIISYGYEDVEAEVRLLRLGHPVGRIKDMPIEHLPHPRGPDSRFNRHMSANASILQNTIKLSPNEVLQSVQGGRGLSFLEREGREEIRTPDELSVKVIKKRNPWLSVLYTCYSNQVEESFDWLIQAKKWKKDGVDVEVICAYHDATPHHRALLSLAHAEGIIDELIPCVSNHGHLKGLAIAFEKCGGELVAVVNNDVIVSSEVLEYCIHRMISQSRLGAIAYHTDPKVNGTFWKEGELIYSKRILHAPEFTEWEKSVIQSTTIGSSRINSKIGWTRMHLGNGSFFVTRRELWEKTGGLNANLTQHYFADDFFFFSLVELGYDVENLPSKWRENNQPSFQFYSDYKWEKKPRYPHPRSRELLIDQFFFQFEGKMCTLYESTFEFAPFSKTTHQVRRWEKTKVIVIQDWLPILTQQLSDSIDSNGFIAWREIRSLDWKFLFSDVQLHSTSTMIEEKNKRKIKLIITPDEAYYHEKITNNYLGLQKDLIAKGLNPANPKDYISDFMSLSSAKGSFYEYFRFAPDLNFFDFLNDNDVEVYYLLPTLEEMTASQSVWYLKRCVLFLTKQKFKKYFTFIREDQL